MGVWWGVVCYVWMIDICRLVFLGRFNFWILILGLIVFWVFCSVLCVWLMGFWNWRLLQCAWSFVFSFLHVVIHHWLLRVWKNRGFYNVVRNFVFLMVFINGAAIIIWDLKALWLLAFLFYFLIFLSSLWTVDIDSWAFVWVGEEWGAGLLAFRKLPCSSLMAS